MCRDGSSTGRVGLVHQAAEPSSLTGRVFFVMFYSSDKFSCLNQKRPHIGIMGKGENCSYKVQDSCGVICLVKLNKN